jgi:GAF domain-containing protein
MRFGKTTRQYAIAGALFGTAFPIVATALRLAQSQQDLSLTHLTAVQGADPLLWIIDTAPLFLGLLAGFAGVRQDSLAASNEELRDREQALTSLQDGLEQRVAQRTEELAQRNIGLRAAVELARQVAEITDTSTLSARAVQLFARFLEGFQVDLYVIDERTQTAILEASSIQKRGEEAARHRLIRVGDGSLVGQAALLREVRIGPVAVEADAEGIAGPPANRLRSEIALPLTAHGQLLGVLALRPAAAGPTPAAETEILRLLADQLAATLDRARLLEEANASIDQLQALTGARTRAGWQVYSGREAIAFQYTAAGVRSVAHGLTGDDTRTLRVALTVRGQQIGSLALRAAGPEGWSADDRDLASKAASQVALALENNRLLEETRQRAVLEQKASEISDRLGRGTDLDTLLQTAVRELASLPEVLDASVFLSPGPQTAEGTSRGSN